MVLRNTPGTGLRRQAVNVFMVSAFALIAAGAAGAVGWVLALDVLVAAAVIGCLAGWRLLVIARRRGQTPPDQLGKGVS